MLILAATDTSPCIYIYALHTWLYLMVSISQFCHLFNVLATTHSSICVLFVCLFVFLNILLSTKKLSPAEQLPLWSYSVCLETLPWWAWGWLETCRTWQLQPYSNATAASHHLSTNMQRMHKHLHYNHTPRCSQNLQRPVSSGLIITLFSCILGFSLVCWQNAGVLDSRELLDSLTTHRPLAQCVQ